MEATRSRLRPTPCRSSPELIYTSVTPFGLTGPRRRWRGSDLVGWASSGALPTIGDPDRAPIAPGGGLAYMTGALNAAMGTMLALMARRNGSGGQLVDVSLQEAVLSVTMEAGPLVVLEGGFDMERTGKRRRTGPLGHYATKDGAVSIVAYMPEHWRTLAEWIREETGVEEVTSEEFARHADGAHLLRGADRPLDRRADDPLHQAGVLRGGATARDHGGAGELGARSRRRRAPARDRWVDGVRESRSRKRSARPRRRSTSTGRRQRCGRRRVWASTTATCSSASSVSPTTTCSRCTPPA